MKLFLIQRPLDNILLISRKSRTHFKEDLQEGDMEGFFGSYPDKNERDALKNQLYFLADQAAERDFQESDYLLRYILTFLCFLFLFFIFSYVVRDPIPMVDEIALSLAGALFFNLWFRKKRAASQKLEMMKLEMRNDIDSLSFSEQELIRNIELYLQNLDAMSLGKKLDYETLPLPVFMNRSDKTLREFFMALDNFWNPRELRKEIKMLKFGIEEPYKDLSLLIVYVCLKKVYSTR